MTTLVERLGPRLNTDKRTWRCDLSTDKILVFYSEQAKTDSSLSQSLSLTTLHRGPAVYLCTSFSTSSGSVDEKCFIRLSVFVFW